MVEASLKGGTRPAHPPFVCAMPRYFFDTDDGNSFSKDKVGLDLPGFDQVRLQAQGALADMARDVVPGDGPDRLITIRVRDEGGSTILRGSLVLRIET